MHWRPVGKVNKGLNSISLFGLYFPLHVTLVMSCCDYSAHTNVFHSRPGPLHGSPPENKQGVRWRRLAHCTQRHIKLTSYFMERALGELGRSLASAGFRSRSRSSETSVRRTRRVRDRTDTTEKTKPSLSFCAPLQRSSEACNPTQPYACCPISGAHFECDVFSTLIIVCSLLYRAVFNSSSLP